jgi:hypothetical protein
MGIYRVRVLYLRHTGYLPGPGTVPPAHTGYRPGTVSSGYRTSGPHRVRVLYLRPTKLIGTFEFELLKKTLPIMTKFYTETPNDGGIYFHIPSNIESIIEPTSANYYN